MSIDNQPLAEYRKSLCELMQKMQSEYDKTVVALSGGAFGISMAFSKDLVGKENIAHGGYLLLAWLSWGLSVSSMLASFFTSSNALEKAIKQTDQRFLYREPVGGFFDKITRFLNSAAGLLFFAGIIFMSVFVYKNIK